MFATAIFTSSLPYILLLRREILSLKLIFISFVQLIIVVLASSAYFLLPGQQWLLPFCFSLYIVTIISVIINMTCVLFSEVWWQEDSYH
jgi:hypothetical protein